MNIAEQELYLIAHAPQTIPDWFKPKMRDKPKVVMYQGEVYPEIHNYYFDEGDEEWIDNGKLSDADKAKYKKHQAKYSTYLADEREWYIDEDLQRIVQWPIFWANEVLKRYQDGY